MVPSLSAAARMGAAAFLLLLVLAPATEAQGQPLPVSPFAPYIRFNILCPQQAVEVDFRGTTQIECTLHDLTKDSGGFASTPTVPTFPHATKFTIVETSPSDAEGWQFTMGRDFVPSSGGDVIPLTFTFQTTPNVNAMDYTVVVEAVYTHTTEGTVRNQTLVFSAQVNPYDFAHVESIDNIKKAGQDEIVRYTLRIYNDGLFPDVYQIGVDAEDYLKVSLPPAVYVPAGESRNVTIAVLTPHDSVYELGKSSALIFKVTSTRGTGVYSAVGTLNIRGPYIPTYWIPLTLVGLVSLSITVKATRERTTRARLERGAPRRVELSPRQEVMLAELKRSDPEAYKARREQLAAVYAARKDTYSEAYAEQRAKDKAEHKLAVAEFKAKKKQRAEERRLEEKRLAQERKAQKAESRLQEKELAAKSKELEKKQKIVEKARAKQAKIDAKQAAQDAKAQAKADALAAKEAKKAQKAAKKAEKKP